jgi:hypothetical protein
MMVVWPRPWRVGEMAGNGFKADFGGGLVIVTGKQNVLDSYILYNAST